MAERFGEGPACVRPARDDGQERPQQWVTCLLKIVAWCPRSPVHVVGAHQLSGALLLAPLVPRGQAARWGRDQSCGR